MKKGTQVKFIGTEKKQSVEATYIWDVVIVSEKEKLYLIEHPEGMLLNEATIADFKGFNVEKLHHGKRYLAAYPNELIDLSNTKTETVESTTVKIEMLTTVMPKAYFTEVKDLIEMQREQCLKSKTMLKLAQGISEEDFNEMIASFTQLITATENALNQTQNV